MATIYPLDGPRPTTSEAERAVYAALAARLPAGWVAWHSLRLWSAGYPEREGDFVIAAPGLGVLVVEVKGGAITLEGGRWLQNGHPLAQAPRQQAWGFARALQAALERRGVRPPPWQIVAAFPDVEFSAGPEAGDVAGLVLGARDLAWLGEVLPALARRALARWGPLEDDAWIDEIHALWGETWVPRVSLADRVGDAARRRLALDREQAELLDLAGDNRRAVVEGGAGTGKTAVARELLARAARAGQRALYLCFTDALAVAVARSLAAERWPGVAPRAAAVRRLAADLLVEAGRAGDAAAAARTADVAARAAREAPPPPGELPDLVVVDEGQDLEPADWALVDALAGDRGLWVFQDRRQRFWRDREAPAALLAGAARLGLRRQHRNPPGLEAFARGYVEPGGAAGAVAGAVAVAGAPAGGPVGAAPAPVPRSEARLVVCGAGEVLAAVAGQVDAMLAAGARPGDVAVLSLAGRRHSALAGLAALGAHPLRRADDADAADHVVADTVVRFKGLDRPMVIVAELVHGPTMQYEVRMHLALTRATVAAVVVCGEADLALDPRLATLSR